jgi:hypothetical protein
MPSRIYQTGHFWFEKIPSGNPELLGSYRLMPRRFPVVGPALVHAVVEVGAEGVVELVLDGGVLGRQHHGRRVALAAEQLQLSGALLRQLPLEVVDRAVGLGLLLVSVMRSFNNTFFVARNFRVLHPVIKDTVMVRFGILVTMPGAEHCDVIKQCWLLWHPVLLHAIQALLYFLKFTG